MKVRGRKRQRLARLVEQVAPANMTQTSPDEWRGACGRMEKDGSTVSLE